MRIIILLFLIISTSVYNDKVNAQIEFNNTDSVINFLVGEWIWINSCGGWTGSQCTYPDSVGYTKSYVFSKLDGSKDSIAYSYFNNDSLIDSRNAKISYSNSIYGDQWNLEENISGFQIGKTTMFFESMDSIIFADNCYDCYKHEFVRRSSLSSNDFKLIDNKLKIFPNPCNNIIHIDLKNYQELGKIIFYNLNGKMIKICRIYDRNIDVSDLSRGIYFVELTNGDERYKAKLIKN
ncbi:MAG: T9SS type A sorting domain-containing protein [Chlorobi bacterium]|nr:T9SS type A sorting domain-containing protein [Chlorobiota bacterium]